MDNHEIFMHRCLQLAEKGRGCVSPNPMVGAVLVHEGRIIGEGFHECFGGPHAEVNAINAVSEEDKNWISDSILYVSLEPCNHFGKTPPCSDLILKSGIKKVVIATLDPFIKVNGSGYAKLLDFGVDVKVGVLENEARKLNARFFCNQEAMRPFIILKWAQTSNGLISAENGKPLKISCDLTNRLVHKWRSEEDAIAVGVNTILTDDPMLNNRLWSGKQPIKVIFDLNGRAVLNSKVFHSDVKTIVISNKQKVNHDAVEYLKLEKEEMNLFHILQRLYQKGIGSMLVEGGAITHKQFIESGLWDEARVIVSDNAYQTDPDNCTKAPKLRNEIKFREIRLATDTVFEYHNEESPF